MKYLRVLYKITVGQFSWENNIQGQGMTPDKLLDLPDASEYGSADDKWVRNAELFLESVLEKEEISSQTSESSDEGIKS